MHSANLQRHLLPPGVSVLHAFISTKALSSYSHSIHMYAHTHTHTGTHCKHTHQHLADSSLALLPPSLLLSPPSLPYTPSVSSPLFHTHPLCLSFTLSRFACNGSPCPCKESPESAVVISAATAQGCLLLLYSATLA